jgi:cytochrome c553
MRRVLKWLAGTLAILVMAALAWIYGASERELRRRWPVAAEPIAVINDSASMAAGEIVARTRGCTGCHGEQLEGKVFFDEPRVARLVPPNLTRVAGSASDADLARMIRHGIRPDGRALVAMPSEMFSHLSDADVAALIGFIRSRPVVEDTLPEREVRFLGRLGLVLGQFQTAPQLIDHSAPRLGDAPEALTTRRGEYLARTTCPECHGSKLEGAANPGGSRTPSLAGAFAYSEDEFVDLVRHEKVKGGRPLELMASVLRGRLRYYSDDDLRAIHRFLMSYRPPGP